MTVLRRRTQPLDLNTLEQLLRFVNAETDRQQWAINLMAIKSEFGEAGKEVARQWSAAASNYNSKAFNATWKSIRSNGAVTIASLIRQALDNGFQFAPISNAERDRLAQQAKARQLRQEQIAQREEAFLQRQYCHKAYQAKMILDKAIQAPANHPYLVRKQIDAHGILYGTVLSYKDALIVPVMGTAEPFKSQVQSLQFINLNSTKRFMAKAKKAGGFYPVQWVNEAPIVICEGFATGATLAQHYAPYSSVICAFDSGNLMAVARVFRQWRPQARIIIAGDNDHQSKINTGKTKAIEAAQAIDGRVSIPEFAPHEVGTDWNDRYLLDQALTHKEGN